MKTYNEPSRDKWNELISRPIQSFEKIKDKLLPVLHAVQQQGDEAIRTYTKLFDRVEIERFSVSKEEIEEASSLVSEELKQAIQQAKRNIELFHEAQRQPDLKIEVQQGVTCSRRSIAIEKVGIYIPGGTAPLFSTVLMLAIPAQLAGCQEIILCTPPNEQGKVHPAILYTAQLTGISKIFKVGGSQAIFGMAYGTDSIPQVDKVFGPGNQYVTAAKQLITQEIGTAIDMPAGPSEVLVYADETAIPSFVASDLLSQAEHGTDSQVILITSSENVQNTILQELNIQLNKLPRQEIAACALENSRSIVLKNRTDAMNYINQYAPEHLILAVKDVEQVAEQVRNAGSVFMGNFTPESAGDYASGTNHTLPTYGYAKAYSGVSLESFQKKITFQQITKQGILDLGPVIETMAEAEELYAHKNAVSLRLKFLQNV